MIAVVDDRLFNLQAGFRPFKTAKLNIRTLFRAGHSQGVESPTTAQATQLHLITPLDLKSRSHRIESQRSRHQTIPATQLLYIDYFLIIIFIF